MEECKSSNESDSSNIQNDWFDLELSEGFAVGSTPRFDEDGPDHEMTITNVNIQNQPSSDPKSSISKCCILFYNNYFLPLPFEGLASHMNWNFSQRLNYYPKPNQITYNLSLVKQCFQLCIIIFYNFG